MDTHQGPNPALPRFVVPRQRSPGARHVLTQKTRPGRDLFSTHDHSEQEGHGSREALVKTSTETVTPCGLSDASRDCQDRVRAHRAFGGKAQAATSRQGSRAAGRRALLQHPRLANPDSASYRTRETPAFPLPGPAKAGAGDRTLQAPEVPGRRQEAARARLC